MSEHKKLSDHQMTHRRVVCDQSYRIKEISEGDWERQLEARDRRTFMRFHHSALEFGAAA
jgi:hypothetical protein